MNTGAGEGAGDKEEVIAFCIHEERIWDITRNSLLLLCRIDLSVQFLSID